MIRKENTTPLKLTELIKELKKIKEYIEKVR